MSTRSEIGIQHEDGTVEYIYCHSDGDLHGVGACLFENYKNRVKVQELIDKGDTSKIGPELKDVENYHEKHERTYRKPLKVPAMEDFFADDASWGYIEYRYLFTSHGWYYRAYKDLPDTEIKSLSEKFTAPQDYIKWNPLDLIKPSQVAIDINAGMFLLWLDTDELEIAFCTYQGTFWCGGKTITNATHWATIPPHPVNPKAINPPTKGSAA
jgi:hypothetical protein